jgi:hypothetical protein
MHMHMHMHMKMHMHDITMRTKRRSVRGGWLVGICLVLLFLVSGDRRFLRSFNEQTRDQMLTQDIYSALVATEAPMTRNASQLPDCQVLIDNAGYNFHYEVLESIFVLYPLPPAATCNHSSLQFTIALWRGNITSSRRDRSTSWWAYANATLVQNEKNYYSYSTPGQSRSLHTVLQAAKTGPPISGWDDFTYIIRATCYCSEEVGDQAWLRSDMNRHFCVFHQACDEYSNSSQAMWLNPHHERYFFPSLLPTRQYFKMQAASNFSSSIPNKPDSEEGGKRKKYRLCILGDPKRREYSRVAAYLEKKNQTISPVSFQNLGRGKIPSVMTPWRPNYLTHYRIEDYEEYQAKIATDCQAILALVLPSTQPDYFSNEKKLSGSVVQAAAYRLPIVLHTDLAKLYDRYIPDVITHGDDQESFNEALATLIERLETHDPLVV